MGKYHHPSLEKMLAEGGAVKLMARALMKHEAYGDSKHLDKLEGRDTKEKLYSHLSTQTVANMLRPFVRWAEEQRGVTRPQDLRPKHAKEYARLKFTGELQERFGSRYGDSWSSRKTLDTFWNSLKHCENAVRSAYGYNRQFAPRQLEQWGYRGWKISEFMKEKIEHPQLDHRNRNQPYAPEIAREVIKEAQGIDPHRAMALRCILNFGCRAREVVLGIRGCNLDVERNTLTLRGSIDGCKNGRERYEAIPAIEPGFVRELKAYIDRLGKGDNEPLFRRDGFKVKSDQDWIGRLERAARAIVQERMGIGNGEGKGLHGLRGCYAELAFEKISKEIAALRERYGPEIRTEKQVIELRNAVKYQVSVYLGHERLRVIAHYLRK